MIDELNLVSTFKTLMLRHNENIWHLAPWKCSQTPLGHTITLGYVLILCGRKHSKGSTISSKFFFFKRHWAVISDEFTNNKVNSGTQRNSSTLNLLLYMTRILTLKRIYLFFLPLILHFLLLSNKFKQKTNTSAHILMIVD